MFFFFSDRRTADALFATLTDAHTLQMYYAKAQCVLFMPEVRWLCALLWLRSCGRLTLSSAHCQIPYIHRSDAQVTQARSKALTTNQPSTLLSATFAEPWLADPVVLLRNAIKECEG